MKDENGEWYFCMYRTDIAPGGLWRDVSSWVAEIERHGSVPHWVPHCVPHCVPNVSVYVFCLSHRETLARQTFLGKMRKISILLCLLHLTSLTHQSQSPQPAGQNSVSSSFPVCPEGRGQPTVEPRRKVCSNVTECETVCEKEDCQTYYKYRKGLRPATLIFNSPPNPPSFSL